MIGGVVFSQSASVESVSLSRFFLACCAIAKRSQNISAGPKKR
jgi:hypothetical protein